MAQTVEQTSARPAIETALALVGKIRSIASGSAFVGALKRDAPQTGRMRNPPEVGRQMQRLSIDIGAGILIATQHESLPRLPSVREL